MYQDQFIFPLKEKTSPDWVKIILADFAPFLVDHAGAERKAHANCLSILSKYQNRTRLVETMIAIATEELQHFGEVVALLHARGLTLADSLSKDHYVQKLLSQLRPQSEDRLIDRLIVTSIVEARGCERFELVGQALKASGQVELATYYLELSRIEARHYGAYLGLAKHYCDPIEVEARFQEFLDYEAALVRSLPLRAALH